MFDASLAALPKADMHVHLEGTITPDLAKKIAARNGVALAAGLENASGATFNWAAGSSAAESLISFLTAYDAATAVMKRAEDYTDITYDYLSRVAAEGCIYAELTISADHGAMVGLSYPQMLDAITAGIDKARDESGIEARMISTGVRHYGPEKALHVGQVTAQHPHPLVTGFGMAGDENAGTIADFKPAFEAAGKLKRTAHAGEASGPATVRQARDILHLRRFGHMVRAIEDANLMRELQSIKAVPEVCVSSNMALKVYADYASHPLRKFFDMGLKVVLGSDDPSFFGSSIGQEYQIARDHFGFSGDELLQLTRHAIEEAFVDDATRARLFKKL